MQYDAIIIGSGQAGNPLAHNLHDQGWTVALIEKDQLGGSCINYGCTPTKTMVASARIAHYARRAAEFGVNTHNGDVVVDLAKVQARKNAIVAQWRGGQEQHAAKRENLHLYRGHGRFTGPDTIEVTLNDGGTQTLTSQHIFINTGTRPRIAAIPGLDTVDYLTNYNIMDVPEIPEHLISLGGSYLGLEFGQMFRRFGSQVSIVEKYHHLLPREDRDVAEELQRALIAEGMEFHCGGDAVAVRKAGSGVEVDIQYQDGSTATISGSHLLVAIGRNPNSHDLGLEAAGIEADKYGWIKTNERLETNVPGIWALGDVKGGPAFTHIAYDDFLVVYNNLIHKTERTINGRMVPYTLFTDPELGRVGLTETQAKQAGYKLKVGKIPMAWVARAIERDETAGLMKVVIDAETDRILGATVLGSEGGELVQTLMALMMADAPWTLFHKAIYVHPTMAEGFFTLMDNVKPIAD